MEELKICKEIINKVKWYTERKDYNGLKLYIDEKEKFIDNYIINLEESLCEKKTQLGYLVISVSDKNGNKLDADIDKKNNTIKSLEKITVLHLSMKQQVHLLNMQNIKGINYIFMFLLR